MSKAIESLDAISAGIDELEIARLKGGLFKMTLQLMLRQEGVRGMDWTPEQVFAQVVEAIGIVAPQTKMSSHYAAIVQDAVAEFRREALDLLRP